MFKPSNELMQYRMALMHLSEMLPLGDRSYLLIESITRYISADDLWKLGVDAQTDWPNANRPVILHTFANSKSPRIY